MKHFYAATICSLPFLSIAQTTVSYVQPVSVFCPYGGPWAYSCRADGTIPTISETHAMPLQNLGYGQLTSYSISGIHTLAAQVSVATDPVTGAPKPLVLKWTSNAFEGMYLSLQDANHNLLDRTHTYMSDSKTINSISYPTSPTQPQYNTFGPWLLLGTSSANSFDNILVVVSVEGFLHGGAWDGYIDATYQFTLSPSIPAVPEPTPVAALILGLATLAAVFGHRAREA